MTLCSPAAAGPVVRGRLSSVVLPGGRVVLAGALDRSSQRALRGVLDRALRQAAGLVTIDTGAVSSVDQTGLFELLWCQVKAAATGRRITIDPLSGELGLALDLLDLRHLLAPDTTGHPDGTGGASCSS